MTKTYEEGRRRRARSRPTNVCYEAWKANPSDENLAALYGALERHARRVMFQRLGCEDEVNAAVLAANVVNNLSKFEGRSSFSTWAHRAILCDVFDLVDRRVIERREKPLSPERVNDQSENVGGLDAARFVETLLSRLGEPEYSIVQGKLAGFSDEELAEKLEVSIGVIKMRWLRLREKICDFYGDSPD